LEEPAKKVLNLHRHKIQKKRRNKKGLREKKDNRQGGGNKQKRSNKVGTSDERWTLSATPSSTGCEFASGHEKKKTAGLGKKK